MNKTRLIDVLNMIAKGELEEGTKIRYSGNVFVYKDSLLLNTQNKDNFSIYGWGSLNEEVEIIGHDTNVATKIEELKPLDMDFSEIDFASHEEYARCAIQVLARRMIKQTDKLNEVIRELNRRGE